ncbi:MAG: diacylglycerol kinase family protein [Planctomycetota bacterium]|jgi:diacylglycerol kinase
MGSTESDDVTQAGTGRPNNQRSRGWSTRFGDAFRGTGVAFRCETSFVVHLPVAACVVGAGFVFRVTTIEWAVLIVCIAIVLAAETFNSAIESLSRAVTQDENPHVRNALDMAAGAVLIAAIGAAAAGLTVFVPHLLRALSG